MTAPFSPVPDDQDESIPAADAGAAAPAPSAGTGASAEEPDRTEVDGATGSSQDTELGDVLHGREEPHFQTPKPDAQ